MAPTRTHAPLENESASPTTQGPAASTTDANNRTRTAAGAGVASAPAPAGTNPAENIAQAYKDLTRGEQTATALEANLSKLESRLDELLAGLEALEEPQGDDIGNSTNQAGQRAKEPLQPGEKD